MGCPTELTPPNPQHPSTLLPQRTPAPLGGGAPAQPPLSRPQGALDKEGPRRGGGFPEHRPGYLRPPTPSAPRGHLHSAVTLRDVRLAAEDEPETKPRPARGWMGNHRALRFQGRYPRPSGRVGGRGKWVAGFFLRSAPPAGPLSVPPPRPPGQLGGG